MIGESRPPFPPFTRGTALRKVRQAEDGWNTRDPQRVALAYTPDSVWRNRTEFLHGREEIVAFLTRKGNREQDYRLIKELWAFDGNRIAVRFAYESHDHSGNWFRSVFGCRSPAPTAGLGREGPAASREPGASDMTPDEAGRYAESPPPVRTAPLPDSARTSIPTTAPSEERTCRQRTSFILGALVRPKPAFS